MTDTASNNKRIAKNTLFLYFRMLLTMGVSLYTVRVVLETLGVVDYGIYNVVGGVVTMFSFLSGTMASASQRFFSFELGRGDMVKLRQTFSMTMQIYVLLGIVILLLAETIGLWFLNTQMNIPGERMDAARWVYQLAVLSFMLTMFTTPYNAAIIAREDMKVYAYISIVEVVLKLLIVYLLLLFSFDKLKLYAVLMFAVTGIVRFIYYIYCKQKYAECTYTYFWGKAMFKEILGFSGWNMIGASSAVLKDQGINILLNLFFGPVVNAARAVAYQTSGAISQFISNFNQAVNPQITKYYATDERENMFRLVFRSSKFSFLLFFCLSLPVLMETEFILSLWLKEVPDYTVLFTRLVIVTALIETLASPLITSALATGRIRNYQIIVGGLLLLNLPATYVFFKLGYPPQTSMYVAMLISTIALFYRLFMLKRMIRFPVRRYVLEVCLRVFGIAAMASIVPFFFAYRLEQGWFRFLIVLGVGIIALIAMSYCLGLTHTEKQWVTNFVKQKIKKK